jgi:hypothetical protein
MNRLSRNPRNGSGRGRKTDSTKKPLSSQTAAVNGDGFVTLDEVVVMKLAGLTDRQMLDRLQVTGQVFELTSDQKQYLRDRGISQKVIDEMPRLNRNVRDRLSSTSSSEVIGPPRK